MAVEYILELHQAQLGENPIVFTGEVAKSLMNIVEIKLELKINGMYFKEVLEVQILRKDGSAIPSGLLSALKPSDDLIFKMIATFTKQPYETIRLAQEQATTP